MNNAVQRYLEAASGLSALTKASAERVTRQLVKQGEVGREQVGEFVDDLLERSRRNRETMLAMVSSEVQRAVRSMGLATSDEVARLQKQVADLRREVAAAKAPAKKAAAKKPAAKKPAAKKPAAKKPTAKKASS